MFAPFAPRWPLPLADIYTVTKEELDFKSNFQLEIIKDDYLHAIVGFFNCEFSKTHTKLWSAQHTSNHCRGQPTRAPTPLSALPRPALLCTSPARTELS